MGFSIKHKMDEFRVTPSVSGTPLNLYTPRSYCCLISHIISRFWWQSFHYSPSTQIQKHSQHHGCSDIPLYLHHVVVNGTTTFHGYVPVISINHMGVPIYHDYFHPCISHNHLPVSDYTSNPMRQNPFVYHDVRQTPIMNPVI